MTRHGTQRLQGLIVAANLARYNKGGELMIMLDKWKTSLGGHHFIDLPSDCSPFEADQKRMVFDGKCQVVYVIQIGQEGDLLPLKFESQLQMDRLPSQTSSTEIFSGHRACYCARAR